MKLAIIAAVASNRVIGRAGSLPWHVSDDLKRFKRLTKGHTVLMGRKTYESLSKPLVDRRNVVITSRPISGVECYPTPESALAALADQERVFVIGGGAIYASLLERADELYLTLVDQPAVGDTYFPPFESLLTTHFRETHREVHPGYTFVDYVRI